MALEQGIDTCTETLKTGSETVFIYTVLGHIQRVQNTAFTDCGVAIVSHGKSCCEDKCLMHST